MKGMEPLFELFLGSYLNEATLMPWLSLEDADPKEVTEDVMTRSLKSEVDQEVLISLGGISHQEHKK